jgi:hypothetical protein
MLRLERIDLHARAEDVLVDLEAGLLEQLTGPNPVRANVVGKDHAVQRGFAARHPIPRKFVICQANAGALPKLLLLVERGAMARRMSDESA